MWIAPKSSTNDWGGAWTRTFPLGDRARVVQLTPPGSACSISFGSCVTPGVELVVDDIDTARADLTGRGIDVSETFHREGTKLAPGPDTNHTRYNSYASFKDPDGNAWLLQEVTTRLPGRATSPVAAYGSETGLADAMLRASETYSKQQTQDGQSDTDRLSGTHTSWLMKPPKTGTRKHRTRHETRLRVRSILHSQVIRPHCRHQSHWTTSARGCAARQADLGPRRQQ